MAEVMNLPVESLDRTGDGDGDDRQANDPEKSPSPAQPGPLPPTQQQDKDQPQQQQQQQPPPPRRRDRDERDADRPPSRRDHYDRNQSPPPRDRDRGYKRRGSSSPPPYRDRRRSPPPPYKRSRREDGGYEGRRGSPRGGFGDRRFGNDYGYDGVRYGEERLHGRYMGRPGYPPEWEGRGGYGDGPGVTREGLMSYKQFIQELEDDILPAEAERRYQEYRSEYISTQKRAYFNAHKDEDWLRDKYHPTNLVGVVERRNELARKNAKDFLLDLQSGALDLGPGTNAMPPNKPGQAGGLNSDEEVDGSGKGRGHGRGPTRDTDRSSAPKAHPVSSEPRRIQIDVEQAQALVRKLDSEKGIEENILGGSDNDKIGRDKSHGSSSGPVVIIRGLTSVKGLEGVELLDTLFTYLWRIHGLDYYGMSETAEPKGYRHIRPEGKVSDAAAGNGAEWEKKLNTRWQERLKSQDPLEIMTAKDKIDAAAVEVLDPYVRKIRDEKYGWKYGCGAKGCTKLFHATEFVYKHLKLKHPELVMELTSKLREELYFQNYMNDPDAPGGQPVMQQTIARDRIQRRRMGLEGRLRDDRVIRRDKDGRPIVGERFNWPDNPQSADQQADKDGADGGNDDNPMFDNFGGQGVHVPPPFGSEIPPPPVLMPVPGAGPLGPFVPAPPEVAMQMFRDQGPLPFEGSGRNGRGGPTPIIASFPGFQQDPRRLRSYQDLDAPDDEVTVIDYRSL